MGARGPGQVPGGAGLDRRGEDVAAGDEECPLPLRREGKPLELGRRGNPRWALPEPVIRHGDRDRTALPGFRVEHLDLAVELVHDPPGGPVAARPPDVPEAALGHRPGAPLGHVEGVEVEGAASVGGEVDGAADPDRVAIGVGVADHPAGRLRGEVEDEEIVGGAAGVALLGPEVAVERGVDDLLSIRRELAGAGLRHRERLGGAAAQGNGEQLRLAGRPAVAARPIDDPRAVVGPAVDLVVPAPARGEGTGGRVPGQLLRLAAGGRHDVDLLVAVVLPGEGDPLPVGGEAREQLHARVGGDPGGLAAGGWRRPDVTAVGEGDPVAADGGEPEQLRLGRGGQRGEQQGNGGENAAGERADGHG